VRRCHAPAIAARRAAPRLPLVDAAGAAC
jgi:hypothetical protein